MDACMKVGMIGLGAMGVHMARNLHKAGLLHGVWNRTSAKAAALATELDCQAAKSVQQLGAACNAVVICVSADEDVLAVVKELVATMQRGGLVIDCSTVSADAAREAARTLKVRGVDFLDCPVSGGVEGARAATLAIMAGGEGAAFERAQPILQALGKTIALLGPSGAGQATKATNQILCAGVIQAVAEAMAFAKAEGLPLEQVIDTLGKGAGSSWYFVHRAPFMAKGAFPAGFRVRLHAKDLRICRSMAKRHGAKLPVVESTLDNYQALVDEGHGDDDISVLFRLKEKLFGSE
jgi:3-hydroxyisobutyrate dehydrogenase